MVPPAAVVMIRGKLKAPTLQTQTVSEVWALFTSKVWGEFCKYSGAQPGQFASPKRRWGGRHFKIMAPTHNNSFSFCCLILMAAGAAYLDSHMMVPHEKFVVSKFFSKHRSWDS